MKERPILFSAPMVRAILAGTKTVTRRIVKKGPVYVTPFVGRDGAPMHEFGLHLHNDRVIEKHVRSPYGAPGDRLWVKETWRIPRGFDKASPSDVAEQCLEASYPRPWSPIKYEADGEERMREMLPDFGGGWGKTRVSIHMPRWASRITLEVVSVRAERLHEIDETDARREGCLGMPHVVDVTPREEFQELWHAINGAESWNANPWVWRVEFKQVQP